MAPHIGEGAQLDLGYKYSSLRVGYLSGYDFQSQRDASLAFKLQNPRNSLNLPEPRLFIC